MKPIDGFFAQLPANLTVNVLDAGDVSAYIGVVKRVDQNGHEIDVITWQPAQLESQAGATVNMPAAKGYNFVIPPITATPTSMKVRIRVDGGVPHDETYTVGITDNEPFGWRIFG